MPKSSTSQTNLPKKIIFQGDTLIVLTEQHLDVLNGKLELKDFLLLENRKLGDDLDRAMETIQMAQYGWDMSRKETAEWQHRAERCESRQTYYQSRENNQSQRIARLERNNKWLKIGIGALGGALAAQYAYGRFSGR